MAERSEEENQHRRSQDASAEVWGEDRRSGAGACERAKRVARQQGLGDAACPQGWLGGAVDPGAREGDPGGSGGATNSPTGA